jgi:hypothetical protein
MTTVISKAEIASHLEAELRFEKAELVLAEKLATSHPTISNYLIGKAEWRITCAEELLRRLPNMTDATLADLVANIQSRKELEVHLSRLSDEEFAESYLQDLWRDHDLVKAARGDGLDVHHLPHLLSHREASHG